jgi:hypothetical protein
LIETDQAVATKVLSAANPSFYGQSGKVSTLQGALNLIGLKGLMEVVSMIGAHKLLVGKLPGYGYEARTCGSTRWRSPTDRSCWRSRGVRGSVTQRTSQA